MNAVLLKYLPAFLYRHLEGRHELHKIINNTSWLFADKILRMGLGLWVGVWVARYLGPDVFGVYSYALAFVAIFSAFANLGLDSVVIRDVVRNPSQKNELLGSAFALKAVGGIATVLLSSVAILFFRPGDHLTRSVVMIIAASNLFLAFDVIDFWFQSQVQSKFTVVAKILAFWLSSITKIVLIYLHAPLLAFAWTGFAELALGAAALVVAYSLRGNSVTAWSSRIIVAKRLIKESWPLLLAYMSYIIYMRIDQVMIGNMLDHHSVGIYSASTTMTEIAISILVLGTVSIFPTLTDVYYRDRCVFFYRYHQATYLYTIVGFIMLAVAFFLGKPAIRLILGDAYLQSYSILCIQICGVLFMANAGLRSSYLTISGNQKILLLTTSLAAVINIALNFFLIPLFKAPGAALATTVTQFLSLFLFNLFFTETRAIFAVQLRALFLIPARRAGTVGW